MHVASFYVFHHSMSLNILMHIVRPLKLIGWSFSRDGSDMLHELNGGGAEEHIQQKTNRLSRWSKLVLILFGFVDFGDLALPCFA